MSNTVKVRLPNGLVLEVLVEDMDETVVSFKSKLSEITGQGTSVKLVVDGRTLKDSETVLSAVSDKIVYVVKEASEGSTSPGISSGLGGLSVEQPNSPNAAMASMLGSLLEKNPEFMKSILMSHPQLKSMMEKSPQLREAMNNPQVIQDMVKLATNQQYYRETMRGADRAMSQLENIPQGFQMLRQMHEQMDTVSVDPLGSKPASKLRGSSPSAKLQSSPLPNPWAPAPLPSVPQNIPLNSPVDYSRLVGELNDLGFTNDQRNMELLIQTKGDLQKAIEILILDDAAALNNDCSENEE